MKEGKLVVNMSNRHMEVTIVTGDIEDTITIVTYNEKGETIDGMELPLRYLGELTSLLRMVVVGLIELESIELEERDAST